MKFAVLILLLVCTVTVMEAKKQRKHREHHAHVPRICQCTLEYYYRPVCGTNGRTYDTENTLACYNLCHPRRDNVGIAHLGRCKDRSHDFLVGDDGDDDCSSSSSSESIEAGNTNKVLTISVGKQFEHVQTI